MIELQRGTKSKGTKLGIDCTLILSLHAELITVTAPWDEPLELASYITPGKRTFVTSTLGEVQGRWCDGPLAHILGNGLVASYVPAGGVATLAVPRLTAQETRGLTWEQALRAEGTVAGRSHRCLIGLFADRLQAFDHLSLRLTADRFELGDALALVLLRQTAPQTVIRLAVPVQAGSLPPPWRRLLQNTGVWLDANWNGEPQDGTLATFADEIPSPLRKELAAHLNLKSDVLPKRLEEARCAY